MLTLRMGEGDDPSDHDQRVYTEAQDTRKVLEVWAEAHHIQLRPGLLTQVATQLVSTETGQI